MTICKDSIDKDLVLLIKSGDLKAYNLLYKKYANKILFFTKKYIRVDEDAEDLLQEMFLVVWRKRHKLDENKSFNSYIFTITFNLIKKYFRRKGVQKAFLDSYMPDSSMSEDIISNIEYAELNKKVSEIVEGFTERRKEVYRLSRETFLTNQEIALKLDISKKTVENHINSSLKELRNKLDIRLFLAFCITFL